MVDKIIDQRLLDQHREQAAAALDLVPQDVPMGTRMFNAFCRLGVSPCVEAVVLRRNSGAIEVLMTQRSMNETAYPGEWHCPGTMFRPMESVDDAFARLEKKELGLEITMHCFCGIVNHTQEVRGHCLSLVFVCSIEGAPEKGQWFNVDRLPKETVSHHREPIIPMAVAAYIDGPQKNQVEIIER